MSYPAEDPRAPIFDHQVVPTGLIISTCLFCQKKFASPSAAGVRLVERSHKCEALAALKGRGETD